MIWNGEFIAKAYVNCVIIWHSRVLLYVFSVFVTVVHGMLGAPSADHISNDNDGNGHQKCNNLHHICMQTVMDDDFPSIRASLYN